MPLYTSDEDANLNVAAELVDTNTIAHHDDIGYTQELITDIEGDGWIAEAYYNQVVNSDTRVKPLDLTTPASKQAYNKVIDFQLSVVQRPDYERNENQEDMMSGVALFYPHTIIPHVGDMFVATYGGRRLIWVLTGESVRVKSNYMNRVYEADFRFYSSDLSLVAELDRRSNQSLTFSEELLEKGKAPILTAKESNIRIGYGELMASTVNTIYRNFLDSRLGTFIIKEGRLTKYDPFVVDFFNKTIGRANLNGYGYPKEYGTGFRYEECGLPTFWEAVLAQDPTWLENAPRYYESGTPVADEMQVAAYSVKRVGINHLYLPEMWEREDYTETSTPYIGSEALWAAQKDKYTEDDSLYFKAIKGQSWTPDELSAYYNRHKSDKTIFGLRKLVLLAVLLAVRIEGRG